MKQSQSKWSAKAKELSRELLYELRITEKDWHKLKGDPDRRAAEQLAGAIIQLLHGAERSEVQNITQQAILWLKREICPPKCPTHLAK